VAKIGTLQADLVLVSAQFVSGMKNAASVVSRSTQQMSRDMDKLGGSFRGFDQLSRKFLSIGAFIMFTRRLNTEARATSEAYKKMTDSVSSSFTTAFGEGINRAIGDTSIELTNLNKAMHIAGEGAAILVAGGLALAESGCEMLA